MAPTVNAPNAVPAINPIELNKAAPAIPPNNIPISLPPKLAKALKPLPFMNPDLNPPPPDPFTGLAVAFVDLPFSLPASSLSPKLDC